MVPVTTAAALKCWETPGYTMGSNNNEYKNRRSDELVINEEDCSSSAKSCMSMGYDFRGKMQCKMYCDTRFEAQAEMIHPNRDFFQTYSWDVARWISQNATAP